MTKQTSLRSAFHVSLNGRELIFLIHTLLYNLCVEFRNFFRDSWLQYATYMRCLPLSSALVSRWQFIRLETRCLFSRDKTLRASREKRRVFLGASFGHRHRELVYFVARGKNSRYVAHKIHGENFPSICQGGAQNWNTLLKYSDAAIFYYTLCSRSYGIRK